MQIHRLGAQINSELGQPLYLPFATGQYRLSLGLKALEIEDWMQFDDRFVSYLQQKADVLRNNYSDAVAGTQTSRSAQQEVLDALLDYLPQRYPTHYQRQGETIANLKTGEVWYPDDFEQMPIDLAGRLVQDDLCLMLPNQSGYRLEAASLCFPLHWRLHDKLGSSTHHIHQSVPSYKDKLAHPITAYFDRLSLNASGYRFNWTVLPTSELVVDPEAMSIESITPESAGATLWIRVERQSFRRFPKTNAILFGIHTYLYPLCVLERDLEAAQGLQKALEQMPAAMQHYKGLTRLVPIVQAYLSNVVKAQA